MLNSDNNVISCRLFGNIRDTASYVEGQVMGFFNGDSSRESHDSGNRRPEIINLPPRYAHGGANMISHLSGLPLFNQQTGLQHGFGGNQFDIDSILRAHQEQELMNGLHLQQPQNFLNSGQGHMNYLRDYENIFRRSGGLHAAHPLIGSHGLNRPIPGLPFSGMQNNDQLLHSFGSSINSKPDLPSSLISVNNPLRRFDTHSDSRGPVRRFDEASIKIGGDGLTTLNIGPISRGGVNPTTLNSIPKNENEQKEIDSEGSESVKSKTVTSENRLKPTPVSNSGSPINQSEKPNNMNISPRWNTKTVQFVGPDGQVRFLEVPQRYGERRRMRRPGRRRRKGVSLDTRGRNLHAGNTRMQLPPAFLDIQTKQEQQHENRNYQQHEGKNQVPEIISRDGFRTVKPDSIINPEKKNDKIRKTKPRKQLEQFSDKHRAYNHKYASSSEERKIVREYFNPQNQRHSGLFNYHNRRASPFLGHGKGPYNFFPNNDQKFIKHFLSEAPNAPAVSQGIGEGATYLKKIPQLRNEQNFTTNFKVFDLGDEKSLKKNGRVTFTQIYGDAESSSREDKELGSNINFKQLRNQLYDRESEKYEHHNFYGYTSRDQVRDLREGSYIDQQQRFIINGDLHRKINEPQTLSHALNAEGESDISLYRRDFTSPYEGNSRRRVISSPDNFSNGKDISGDTPFSIQDIIDSPKIETGYGDPKKHPLRPLIMDIFKELQDKTTVKQNIVYSTERQGHRDIHDYRPIETHRKSKLSKERLHSVNLGDLTRRKNNAAESGLKIRPASFEMIEIYSKNRNKDEVKSSSEYPDLPTTRGQLDDYFDSRTDETAYQDVRKKMAGIRGKSKERTDHRNREYRQPIRRKPAPLPKLFRRKPSNGQQDTTTVEPKTRSELIESTTTAKTPTTTTKPRRRTKIRSKVRRRYRTRQSEKEQLSVSKETDGADATKITRVITRKRPFTQLEKIPSNRETLSAELDSYIRKSTRLPARYSDENNFSVEEAKDTTEDTERRRLKSNVNAPGGNKRRRIQYRNPSDMRKTARKSEKNIIETQDAMLKDDASNIIEPKVEELLSPFREPPRIRPRKNVRPREDIVRPAKNRDVHSDKEILNYDFSFERTARPKETRYSDIYSSESSREQYTDETEYPYYSYDEDMNYSPSIQHFNRANALVGITTPSPQQRINASIERLKALRDKISINFHLSEEDAKNPKKSTGKNLAPSPLSSFTSRDAIKQNYLHHSRPVVEDNRRRQQEPDVITIEDFRRNNKISEAVVEASLNSGSNIENGFSSRRFMKRTQGGFETNRSPLGSVIDVKPYAKPIIQNFWNSDQTSTPVTFVDPSGRVNYPVHSINLQIAKPLHKMAGPNFGSIENLQKLHLSPTDLFKKDPNNFASLILNSDIKYGNGETVKSRSQIHSPSNINGLSPNTNIVTGRIPQSTMGMEPWNYLNSRGDMKRMRAGQRHGNRHYYPDRDQIARAAMNSPYENLNFLQPLKLVSDDPQIANVVTDDFPGEEIDFFSGFEGKPYKSAKQTLSAESFGYSNEISFGQNYRESNEFGKVNSVSSELGSNEIKDDENVFDRHSGSIEGLNLPIKQNFIQNKVFDSNEKREGALWLQREIALVKSGQKSKVVRRSSGEDEIIRNDNSAIKLLADKLLPTDNNMMNIKNIITPDTINSHTTLEHNEETGQSTEKIIVGSSEVNELTIVTTPAPHQSKQSTTSSPITSQETI